MISSAASKIRSFVVNSKGSFYHHFESKEQFGVELLKRYVAEASAYKHRILLSTEPEPNARDRLLTLLQSNIGNFLENNGKCQCLVVKLASEIANFSEPMREVLAQGHEDWAKIMTSVIREGIENGQIADTVDPERSARVLGNLWMGAMQHAMIAHSAEPLRGALKFISNDLIPAP